MITFKHTLVSDVFKKFKTDSTTALYIVDQNGVCIASEDIKLIGKNISSEDKIQEVLTRGDGSFPVKSGGEKRLMVFHKSENTGWTIVQELSYSYLDKQRVVLLSVTLWASFAVLMISMILTIFLSHRITQPVRLLQRRLKQISEGNFERDISVEGEDEIGVLGSKINQMAVDIQKLLGEILEDEAVKRKLEISMLQSQINPHFLYNTLNTIKWIAIIQKADGASDAISALGRLLRNTICDSAEKITIKEEIQILNDYMYIQNLRYNGRIHIEYTVSDDAILN